MKKKIISELENFKTSARSAILPAVMVILIFLMTWQFFGTENIMIGTFETLSFLRFRSMRHHYDSMVRNFAVFLVMAPIAALAGINLASCIIVNALALFWIAYFLMDEYHPNNYFPAGMALIMFQMTPVSTLPALANRMLAVAASLALVSVIIFIYSLVVKHKDPLPEYISRGFENCEKQLALCGRIKSAGEDPAADGDLAGLHAEMLAINKQISDEIYAANRDAIWGKGKTNWYCPFVLFFQAMNYLTLHCDEGENLTDAESLYSDYLHRFRHVSPDPNYHRLHLRLHGADIRSFRLRFALRQVIAITPCIIFARASGLPNVAWLIISVFFMMIPFTDHTLRRVRQRVLGTVSGVIASFILYIIFPGLPGRIAIMSVANYLIYASGGYGFTTAYITCSVLAIQAVAGAVGMVLLHRVVYTLAGAGIALMANLFIFPVRTRSHIDYLADRLHRLTEKMENEDLAGDMDRSKREQIADQDIIQSYLLAMGIESMVHSMPEEQRDFDFESFEREHMAFIERYLSEEFLKRN